METEGLKLTADSYELLRIMFDRDYQFHNVIAELRKIEIAPEITEYTFTFTPVIRQMNLGPPCPPDTGTQTRTHKIRLTKTPEGLWRVE